MPISKVIEALNKMQSGFGDIEVKIKVRNTDGYSFANPMLHTVKPMGAASVFVCIETDD